jgi:hypothetical protein
MTGFERVWQLIRQLHKVSSDGKIDWQSSAARGTYMVAFPRYAVDIREEENFNNSTNCILRIFDGEGNVIDELSDEQLSRELPDTESHKVWKTMDSLFSMARSRALGVDAALDSILSVLTDLEGPSRVRAPEITDDDVPF